MSIEAAISITAKILEARQFVQKHAGARYPVILADWVKVLRAVMEHNGFEALKAATFMIDSRHCDAFSVAWILTAAAEIIEADAK